MPPAIASLLTAILVLFLLWREARMNRDVSGAIWIPTIWVLLLTTKNTSSWLNMFGIAAGAVSLEEGSPIDAAVWTVLILAGLKILHSRGVSLSAAIRNNRWLALYIAYCLVSITWSDFPFVALKRWIKDLGNPIMILIILSEQSLESALGIILRRCAYVVVPVSILFIKYYPEWGRGFNAWSGAGYSTGITDDKNALGYDCLIFGFYFAWNLVVHFQSRQENRRNELLLSLGFLAMIGWLLTTADSKTPLVALMIGTAVLIFSSLRSVNKRYIGTYILLGAVVLTVIEASFGVYEELLRLLGRNATLTERTSLWNELLVWGQQNPILGVGHESFWLGARREQLWQTVGFQVNQAHNGYLETYLNLGIIGLVLLVGLLMVTFVRVRRSLLLDDRIGRFRFGFFFAVLAYNWTEAHFHGLSVVLLMFLAISMEYRMTRLPQLLPAPEPRSDDAEQIEKAVPA